MGPPMLVEVEIWVHPCCGWIVAAGASGGAASTGGWWRRGLEVVIFSFSLVFVFFLCIFRHYNLNGHTWEFEVHMKWGTSILSDLSALFEWRKIWMDILESLRCIWSEELLNDFSALLVFWIIYIYIKIYMNEHIWEFDVHMRWGTPLLSNLSGCLVSLNEEGFGWTFTCWGDVKIVGL